MSDLLTCVPHEKLERLLELHGVAREFIAFSGEVIQTPLENRVGILHALGFELEAESDVDELLRRAGDGEPPAHIESVQQCHDQDPAVILTFSTEELSLSFTWVLKSCDTEEMAKGQGVVQQGDFRPEQLQEIQQYHHEGKAYSVRRLPLGQVGMGYFELCLEGGDKNDSGFLVSAPGRCHEPEWLRQGKKIWGISCQLYTLKEEDNWGIGDFADLSELVILAANQGADFILLNPLHALSVVYPQDASPYSPVDRRYLNPLYIRPELSQDYTHANDIQAWRESIEAELQLCRAAEAVDYPRVFRHKFSAFERMYKAFRHDELEQESERTKSWQAFVQEGGEHLQDFARFQSAREIPGIDCGQDPQFHLYLQWVAAEQLAECYMRAGQAGMKIGLIRDLAVGGNENSCEVTTNDDLFCLNARIGAPPDYMNPDGQNWGLPPLRPDRLKQTRFAHFIQLLQTNMISCGALRIDHVMALMRLWWCPNDGSNAAGAYVHYPVDIMFAILRLESQRAHCMVIGEDLGVVPPEIRGYLDDGGLLSNVLFYFEKYDGWHFRRPEHFKPKAMAFVANHDVPPLKAWWNGSDISLRRTIGLLVSDEQKQAEYERRVAEKNQLLDLFAEYDLLPESWHQGEGTREYDQQIAEAIFRWCALSASQLLSVQIDDLAVMETPVNIPGTSREYENWSRKVSVGVDEMLESSLTRALMAVLHEARP